MDKSTLSAKLSAVIRAERIKQGLQAKTIAAQCYMSSAMYSHIENGKRDISVNRLEQVSEALGLKPSTLISRASSLHVTES